MINGNAQLTELELTKLENFALKHTAMQQALQQNLTARNKFIEQIEAAHPGYHWNEQGGGLVRVEEGEPAQAPAQA